MRKRQRSVTVGNSFSAACAAAPQGSFKLIDECGLRDSVPTESTQAESPSPALNKLRSIVTDWHGTSSMPSVGALGALACIQVVATVTQAGQWRQLVLSGT